MASVQTQSFSQILANAAAAIQGAASALIDFSVGSVLRAGMEAATGVALWLQGVALQIASLTRFATSNGTDADSFGADFNFPRLPAKTASGQVTFSRFTPTAQATVSVGAIIQTADGSQQYQVIADTNQSAFNTGLQAYVIPASTISCTATVVALVAGAAGNVTAGLINTLGSAIPGVDTVTNGADFVNGEDAETDPEYKARFPQYMASLSKATPTAVENAILSIQEGISYSLVENETYAGSAQRGYFYVVVDDGTGSPSSEFLSAVSNAIEAVRPVGTQFGVFAPTIVTANVALTVTAASGYTHSAVAALAHDALDAYINTLPIGATLTYTRLAQIAYDASPGITNVTAVTLNSATADLTATAQEVLKAGTVAVS